MVILADHDAWESALVLERSALEYYGRAAYFARHPDHAIWTVAVERLQVLIEKAASADERVALTIRLSEARRKHADLTPESRQSRGLIPFHQVRIADMIRDGLGNEGLQRYRAASLVLHGDLYASNLSRRRNKAVNAALLNAASGIVSMCDLMLSWHDKPPRGLTERAFQAEDETHRLARRYGDAFLIEAAFEPEDTVEQISAEAELG